MILTHYFHGICITPSINRFDIVESKGYYKPFETVLINKRGPNKGGLSFHRGKRPENWKGGLYDFAITKSKKYNITTIKRSFTDLLLGYGDIHQTNDACLIKQVAAIDSNGYSDIHLFIAKDMKNEARNLYNSFKDGGLDAEIELLQKQVEIRFNFLDYCTPVEWVE